MKSYPIDLSVLLIQAPVNHPACRPRKEAVVASKLASLVQSLEFCDTGLDFIKKVIMNPDSLLRMTDGAARGSGSRRSQETDGATARPARFLKTGIDAGQFEWTDLPEVLERLQSADGRRPEVLIEDLKVLDFALDVVSAAYAPIRLTRHGCSHPGLTAIEDLIAFRDNPDANPFWPYAFEQWQPFAESHAPDAAVLCVSSAGQMPAAATLAEAWHQRWPGIPLLAVGTEDLTAEGRKKLFYEDRLPFAGEEVGRLAAQLPTMNATDSAGLGHDGPIQGSRDWLSGHRAPLEQPLIADRIPAYAQAAATEGRKLIVWCPGNGEADSIARQLHTVARQGIWNHLILIHGRDQDLEKFALANANIVHSWCRQEPALSPFSDPICRYPDTVPAYGETAPMPGYPLWMALRDPVFIEAALVHFDLYALMRMRVRNDGRSLFEVGQNLHYHYVSPMDLPEGYLEEIVRMVAAGGSVNTQFVKYNLERAHLIAYAEEEGVIIGNSSLKHPRDEYIEAVSQQSGIDLHNFLERGYTSVRPEYRGLGIGAQLLAGLTERAGDFKIFSVIAEGNIATQKMAIRNRTRRVATFFSQRAHKEVSVWIPEWMLPEGIDLPEQPKIET